MAANFHKWHLQDAIENFNVLVAFASLPLVTRQTIGALPGNYWNIGDWLHFLPNDFDDWPEEIRDPYEVEGVDGSDPRRSRGAHRGASSGWVVPTDPGWVLRYAVTRYKEKHGDDSGRLVGWTADEVELGVRISLGTFQVGADSLLAAAFHLLKKIEETDP